MTKETKSYQLSAELKSDLDKWLAKYPPDQKSSAVLTALTLVQKEQGGWIKDVHVAAVAAYLDMAKISVYEVATFYTMIQLSPVGKYQIDVCTNISCMLCGSKKIVEHLEMRLGIKMGEMTKDGKFMLRSAECLAACTKAPMMLVNQVYHENLTRDKVDQILNGLATKS